LLARVNDSQDAVSESSRGSDDSRGLLTGDLCTSGFGDNIYVKNNNTLRIGFQNVGGFPTQLGKIKEDNIRMGVQKWDFDVFGMAEVNLDWRLLQERERLPTRTQEWWETQHVSWHLTVIALQDRSGNMEAQPSLRLTKRHIEY